MEKHPERKQYRQEYIYSRKIFRHLIGKAGNCVKKGEFIRRHPVVLFLYILYGILTAMLTMHPLFLAVSCLLATLYGIFLGGRAVLQRLLWVAVPVAFFTMLLLPLFSHNGVTPLFYINDMAVTKETILYGGVMTLLLATVFQWCQLAQLLFDSEKLLYLCGRLTPSLGLLVAMVLRLVPLLAQRFRQIREGQKGLGYSTAGMSWFGRSRQFVRELSILAGWSLELSLETSVSMESRGYGCGRRTSFHLFRIRTEDVIWCIGLGFCLFLSIAGLTCAGFDTVWFPMCSIGKMGRKESMTLLIFAAGAVAPFLYDLRQQGGA